MPSGLVALLDDVAAIAKLAAASLDDVAAATGRVGLKAAGVVVDDTAVTPGYVVGLTPDRELPIIGRIALGSLRNKLIILLPAAVALSALAPWAVTPLLVVGGLFLCFEGTEKVVEALWPPAAHGEAHAAAAATSPDRLEDQKVSGAVRTDLILSAEIMAIALGDVADEPLWEQAVVLGLVGVAITVGVYGVVGLLVKLDDVGLHLVRTGPAALRGVGRALVLGMPVLMRVLSAVGTAAMLWVGGGIVLHGLEAAGSGAASHALHAAAEHVRDTVPVLPGVLAWLVAAAGAGVVGLACGGIVLLGVAGWRRLRRSFA